MNLTARAVLLSTLILAVPAEEGFSEAKLNALKSGTAYILAITGKDSGASGSGFLARKVGKTGYIVTNHHVVRPDGKIANLFVVLGSGTKQQQRIGAVLVADDAARDLAVLAIESDKLPEPLQLAAATAVHETQSLFVFGFPFGESLSSSAKHPTVTISRAGVSSLRRDDNGRLVTVQLDGALNPGNSGGPVVAADGTVVGVSVASILGAQIGMAIPVHEVADLLAGRPTLVALATTSDKKCQARVDCTVTFADPLKRLTAASVLVVPMDQVKDVPQVDKNGAYVRLSQGMKEYPLTLRDGTGTASFVARSTANDPTISYYVQVRSTSMAEPQRHWEWPWMAIDVSGTGKATASSGFGTPRHEDKKKDKGGKDDGEPAQAKDGEPEKPAEQKPTEPKPEPKP
jgi:S1-C subfamily serine protease